MERKTLLIAVENLQGQNDFISLGKTCNVEIIAFKTRQKNDFPHLLSKCLHSLTQQTSTESIRQKIAFVKDTLNIAGNSKWQKSPEKTLLDAAMEKVREKGLFMTYPLTFRNTVYAVQTA